MGKQPSSLPKEGRIPSSDIFRLRFLSNNNSISSHLLKRRADYSMETMMSMGLRQSRKKSYQLNSRLRNNNKKCNTNKSSRSRNSYTMIPSRNLSSHSIPLLSRPKLKRRMLIGRHTLSILKLVSSGKLYIKDKYY